MSQPTWPPRGKVPWDTELKAYIDHGDEQGGDASFPEGGPGVLARLEEDGDVSWSDVELVTVAKIPLALAVLVETDAGYPTRPAGLAVGLAIFQGWSDPSPDGLGLMLPGDKWLQTPELPTVATLTECPIFVFTGDAA